MEGRCKKRRKLERQCCSENAGLGLSRTQCRPSPTICLKSGRQVSVQPVVSRNMRSATDLEDEWKWRALNSPMLGRARLSWPVEASSGPSASLSWPSRPA